VRSGPTYVISPPVRSSVVLTMLVWTNLDLLSLSLVCNVEPFHIRTCRRFTSPSDMTVGYLMRCFESLGDVAGAFMTCHPSSGWNTSRRSSFCVIRRLLCQCCQRMEPLNIDGTNGQMPAIRLPPSLIKEILRSPFSSLLL
jgi:hypothetical protein